MCIQTPGSLVWAGSLAARLGAEGWSTWGVYVVTACLQGTLLVMAVYFEYFGPGRKERGFEGDVVPNGVAHGDSDERGDEQHRHATEETPLLGGD